MTIVIIIIGLSGGEVAGIVIAILLLIVVLIIVGVVIAFLWRSPHYYKHSLPPPSRKGSVRLTESQKVVVKLYTTCIYYCTCIYR